MPGAAGDAPHTSGAASIEGAWRVPRESTCRLGGRREFIGGCGRQLNAMICFSRIDSPLTSTVAAAPGESSPVHRKLASRRVKLFSAT